MIGQTHPPLFTQNTVVSALNPPPVALSSLGTQLFSTRHARTSPHHCARHGATERPPHSAAGRPPHRAAGRPPHSACILQFSAKGEAVDDNRAVHLQSLAGPPRIQATDAQAALRSSASAFACIATEALVLAVRAMSFPSGFLIAACCDISATPLQKISL